MVGKSQTTLAGRQRLRVVNFRLSQPPFPGQFSVITTMGNPKFTEAYYNRGVTYGKFGNYQQAIKDYNKVIELNPQYAKTYYNRGVTYGSFGNYQQAIKDYNKAIELNPQDAEAYYNRGATYGKLGNYQQDIENSKIAAGLGHKHAQDFLRSEGIKW